MTKEEAKTVLQWVYETYFKPTYIPHSLTPNALAIEDAFNMAIKALSAEPCEDAISRKEIKSKLVQLWNSGGDIDYCMETLRDFIDEETSVIPIRPKGHWIETDEWRETIDGFEQWGYFRQCSKCGYVFKFLEIDNFCPNCGADMREVEE